MSANGTESSSLYVHLDTSSTPLPGKRYLRFICKHMDHTAKCEVEDHYALDIRGARHCRLLDGLLDVVDFQLKDDSDPINGPLHPVYVPQATRKGFERVFTYLEHLQNKMPSTITAPLRNPIEECIQPWELAFVMSVCMDSPPSPTLTTSAEVVRAIMDNNGRSIDALAEVAMISDFLLIEPLSDLVCAFIASVGLSVRSEADLLRLCGRTAPLSEAELQCVYDQLPFLRSQ